MIRLTAVVLGVALATLGTQAHAHPYRHHHHYDVHRVHHHWRARRRNFTSYVNERPQRQAFDPARAWSERDPRRSGSEPSLFQAARAATAPIGWGGSYMSRALAHVGEGARQVGVRSTLWCAAFVNKVLGQSGIRGTGSDLAASFSRWGHRAGPQPGAVAVMSRRGGGHVGIVLRDNGSTVTVVSGNHGRRVAVSEYPKSRIYAYRMP